MENKSRQKELTELAELKMERLQLKFRLLFSQQQDFFYQSEHQRLDEMRDVFINRIHIARCAEEKAEASAATSSVEARSLSEQLTAAQSALATAEESAARSTTLAQRHLEALRTLPILPQSALSEARQHIGAGGCGTIIVQGLSLAFKRPQVTGDPVMDEVYYKTFVAEAALMAELRHPNLVQCVAAIHDDAGRLAAYGMPRGQHDLWHELQYILHLCPKRNPVLCCVWGLLRSYGGARPFGPFPVARVKTVGLAVISALRYLFFTAGVTHHDVKLGNVLAMMDDQARVNNDGFSAELGAYRGTPGESVHPYSTLGKWCPGPHDDLWGLAMMLAAGLENLDLDCCAYGILCPTRDQRLAVLQAQWDIQIRPQPKIPCELLDGLHQILRLSDNPQIASSAASSAAALDMLEAALHKMPDPVSHPSLCRHAYDYIPPHTLQSVKQT
ncbi:g2834 [Coccomyxa elongata]